MPVTKQQLDALKTGIINATVKNMKKLKDVVSGGAKVPAPTPAELLSKGEKVVSARASTTEEVVNTVKGHMEERGTGTILDLPIAAARSIGPVKKLLPDDKYRNLLYSYQNKIVNADVAAGEALASKNKTLKKMFTTTDMKPTTTVTTDKGHLVQAYTPTESVRLSAAVDKTKNFVGPLLAFYGADSLIREIDGEKRAADESVDSSDNIETVDYTNIRTILMNKIASHFGVDNSIMEKVAEAASMLKEASEKIASLETEVSTLKTELHTIAKAKAATKLARTMVTKGLIKSASENEQIDYIMGLDDEGFRVLNKTVGDAPISKFATYNPEIEKVGFLFSYPSTDTDKPTSLEEEIISLSNRK